MSRSRLGFDTRARCSGCNTITRTEILQEDIDICYVGECSSPLVLALEPCPAHLDPSRGFRNCFRHFFDYKEVIKHCYVSHANFCHLCHRKYANVNGHRKRIHKSIETDVPSKLRDDIENKRCPESAAWSWSDYKAWKDGPSDEPPVSKEPSESHAPLGPDALPGTRKPAESHEPFGPDALPVTKELAEPNEPLGTVEPPVTKEPAESDVPLKNDDPSKPEEFSDTSADDSPSQTSGTPLPPSVEQAYYRKCIALKRRLNEIEANNEAAHVRKARLERGIMKMRLERAFLMERLAERMTATQDESDRSTSPPPTVGNPTQPGPSYIPTYATPDSAFDHLRQPQEKPTRSKRANNSTTRQKTPPLESTASAPSHHSPTSNQQPSHLPPMSQMAPSAHSTPDPQRLGSASGGGGGAGGLFSFNTNARPDLAASPLAPTNGTPATPFSGSQHPPLRPLSRHGMPALQQPQFVDNNGYDGTPRPPSSSRNGTAAAENGSLGEHASERRAYAPSAGATGEMLSAGPEIKTDANGERRIQGDTEMADAPPPSQGDEQPGGPPGFGGGFTAVNR